MKILGHERASRRAQEGNTERPNNWGWHAPKGAGNVVTPAACPPRLLAHLYLARCPSRMAAPCSRSRNSGVTKGDGVSSRIFWCRRCGGAGGRARLAHIIRPAMQAAVKDPPAGLPLLLTVQRPACRLPRQLTAVLPARPTWMEHSRSGKATTLPDPSPKICTSMCRACCTYLRPWRRGAARITVRGQADLMGSAFRRSTAVSDAKSAAQQL